MGRCGSVRALLGRVAEGEATPAQAMRVARHLPLCTACRILLAREHRLGQMLENDLEDQLTVGEGFVAAVMANLPQEPPPRAQRQPSRRFHKLA